MAELEDEDNFPNDFDGFDFDNIPGLQPPTVNGETPKVFVPNIVASTTASPVSYVGSSNVEDMDSTFLAAVDALEARVLGGMQRDSDSPQGEATSRMNQALEYSMRSPGLSRANRKGKRKAEPQEDVDVRAILAGYETELTCPICCDLLVGAQVANPCGHTCCGECGYGWLARNEYEPTCAVCRSNLSTRNPLLPNYAVDNLVRQHLETLARSGRPEWQQKGYRMVEWTKRVGSWKQQADARAAKKKLTESARLRRRQQRFYEAEDYINTPPWRTHQGMEDDEPLVARAMPRRGTRSRHQFSPGRPTT